MYAGQIYEDIRKPNRYLQIKSVNQRLRIASCLSVEEVDNEWVDHRKYKQFRVIKAKDFDKETGKYRLVEDPIW